MSNKPNHPICCGFNPAGQYMLKVSRRERRTKPIGRAWTSPANPKSGTRNLKQTQNPNVQNPAAADVNAAPNRPNLLLLATSRAALVLGREIRDTRYEIRADHVDVAPNKANLRGRGRDWGLGIVDW
jgi:hypothetical protein